MLHYHGNIELLERRMIGFLSSQTIPFFCDDVLMNFVRKIKETDIIITSGHSYMEKQLFNLLLQEGIPFIWVLARGIPESFKENINEAISKQKLLIISPFNTDEILITGYRSMMRNRFIIETAHKMVIGYIRKNGLLDELLEDKTYCLLMK
ncbi:MAG: DNA-processing protein DprA [Bacteroidales bacterium]